MLFIFSAVFFFLFCMWDAKVDFLLLLLLQMSNYELKIFYYKCSCNVNERERESGRKCLIFAFGPDPNEWFMNETVIRMTQSSLRRMRGPPEERDIFGRLPSRRGKNWLRILNIQVVQLAGVGGRAARGEQSGWCSCSRKVRRGMCVMTAARRAQIIHGDL